MTESLPMREMTPDEILASVAEHCDLGLLADYPRMAVERALRAAGRRLTADAFARQFVHIKGAHNGDDFEPSQGPCEWCRLAGEQAAEAAAAILAAP